MITNNNTLQAVNGRFVSPVDLYGNSSDTKPTDVANGSSFTEIDTGKKFWFDFGNRVWIDPTAPADDDEEEEDDDT